VDGRDALPEMAREVEPEVQVLDPELERCLRALSVRDREALLLVAWEDLTPALAARSLGVSQAAFRVRLHRSRKRLRRLLAARESAASVPQLEVEKS
jgi:RNA polymerase sigma-70 factor (ECF subfamily)